MKVYRPIEAMLEMEIDSNETRQREESRRNRTPKATALHDILIAK